MKSLKYISKIGAALAVSLPIILSSSCKKSTLEGTVKLNREGFSLREYKKQRNLIIDPLEENKPSFLIGYDVKSLNKDYKEKLENLSRGDTVKVSKKYFPWSRNKPDYKISFD